MRQTTLGRMKRILRSETGQMSVFIALIFQVLFVFFAMVINIGLIVHDKINLQNAVDLGAYYAAQRQAEILNEIAHINYQIRQDYKLLVWRYRVLGTLGGRPVGVSPARSPLNSPVAEVPWNGREEASVCVANSMWREVLASSTKLENYCFQEYNNPVPLVPVMQVIAAFIPGIGAARASSIAARENQILSCQAAAPLNWAYAMQMLYAYKLSIAGRKAMIMELRKKLVASAMVDQNSEPVRDGVEKTILNNLTASNKASFSDQEFQVYNGLSADVCAGGNLDGEPTLPEIQTAPILNFTNTVSLTREGECRFFPLTTDRHREITNQAGVASFDPDQLMRALAQEPDASSGDNRLLHSSLGFEKNPWCMAYVGVRARTQPRKPFAPFGAPITLEARSFAQPFGGRIGPWYKSTWSKAAPRSDGADRVDPLTSARSVGNAIEAASGLERYPNYSRFPGDTLGLKSQAAIASTRNLIQSYESTKLSLKYYSTFDDLQLTGDPLAWDPNQPQDKVPSTVANLRRAELVAIAPDLFDATYYSIDPQYYSNYLIMNERAPRFPNLPTVLGKKYAPMPDLGARNGVASIKAQGVAAQIEAANGRDGNPGLDPLLMQGTLAYPIRKFEHLLTAWAPRGASDFNFPENVFGTCAKPAASKMMVPGGCAQGGRVGYSVRIVSRDHLISETWKVGGADAGAGSILNPPPADF